MHTLYYAKRHLSIWKTRLNNINHWLFFNIVKCLSNRQVYILLTFLLTYCLPPQMTRWYYLVPPEAKSPQHGYLELLGFTLWYKPLVSFNQDVAGQW